MNSRIHNLHKAIYWIEKQSLGLRHEAIAWIKRQSIGSYRFETQAIDWVKSNRLETKQSIGTPSPSLKHTVTG